MYDLGELIGRYVLTGIILWAVLLIMLVIRLTYVAFKPENGGMDFINLFDPKSEGKKSKITIKDIIEYILWPYELIRCVHVYMQREKETFERIRKLQENTKS